VQEVYLGNVCTAGEGQAPTRQATLGAGIRPSMFCPSGLKSVLYITKYFGHKNNEKSVICQKKQDDAILLTQDFPLFHG